jgi:hypothetical protein
MALNDITHLNSGAVPDSTNFVGACRIDDTHVLLVFGESSAIFKKVQVFEVDPSDGSITPIGTALTVASSVYAMNSSSRIVMLDSTTAALIYATGSSSQAIRTLSINLSTYAVTTKGAAYTGMFNYGGFGNLYAISSTRLLHVGNDTANDGWVTMLAVDASTGDISSLSAAVEFEPSNCSFAQLILVSSSRFIIQWAGVSSDGFHQAFSYTSTTITALSSPVEFDTSDGQDPGLVAIDSLASSGGHIAAWRGYEPSPEVRGGRRRCYEINGSNAMAIVSGSDLVNFGTSTLAAENNALIQVSGDLVLHVYTQNTEDYAQAVAPNGTYDPENTGTGVTFTPNITTRNYQLCKLTDTLYVWAHGFAEILSIEITEPLVTIDCSETVETDATARKLPSRRLSETIEATDTARARISAKILSDLVEASDSLSRTLGRFLLDSVNVSDAFAKMKVIFLGLSDSISVTDIISRTISRVFTETVNATDTALRTLGRTLSESVNVAVSMLKVAGKVFTETLAVSDSLIRALLISFSETVEVIASKMHTLGRSFAESVLVASSMIKTVGKSLSETVFAVDSILRSLGRSLVEAITALDRGGIVIGKFFNESVSVAASITRSVGKFFTERIKATVHIRFKINGFTAGVWAKVTRVASSWTGSARVTSAWSKVSKITSTWRKVDRQE